MRGRDVRAFSAAPAGQIIWTHDPAGRPLPSLPAEAARHFARHGDALHRRADDLGGVPWALFRTAAGREVPRVIWADLGVQLQAACLAGAREQKFVPLNTCYVVICRHPATALALTAWLNSTWSRAIARALADRASGGYARYNARSVGSVPMPAGVLRDVRLAAITKRAAAGEEIQEELDEITASWLGLSVEHRAALSEMVGVGAARRRRGAAGRP